MKSLKSKIILGLILAFAVLQILPSERPVNKEVADTDIFVIEEVDQELKTLIQSACYDCHSNQSKHPWYSSLAPVSWWINEHIEDGRKHLNFSIWAEYDSEKKEHKMEECVEMLEDDEMPLWSYQLAHGEARLSDEERTQLINYFAQLQKKY